MCQVIRIIGRPIKSACAGFSSTHLRNSTPPIDKPDPSRSNAASHGFMATATDHQHFDKPAPNGKLNGGSAARAAHARHISGDSAIEAFPPFDPDAAVHHQEQEDEAAHHHGGAAADDDADDNEERTTGTAATANGNGRAVVQRPIVTSTDPEAAAQQLRVRPAERVTSPVTSPPYWAHAHNRTASSVSVESVLPAGAITLQDNEAADDDDGDGRNGAGSARSSHGRDRNRACWAKSVEVTDHVVVNGSATNIGAFVVWNIRVETLSVSLGHAAGRCGWLQEDWR